MLNAQEEQVLQAKIGEFVKTLDVDTPLEFTEKRWVFRDGSSMVFRQV